MKYTIEHRGGWRPYHIIDETGKVVGTSETKEAAEKSIKYRGGKPKEEEPKNGIRTDRLKPERFKKG